MLGCCSRMRFNSERYPIFSASFSALADNPLALDDNDDDDSGDTGDVGGVRSTGVTGGDTRPVVVWRAVRFAAAGGSSGAIRDRFGRRDASASPTGPPVSSWRVELLEESAEGDDPERDGAFRFRGRLVMSTRIGFATSANNLRCDVVAIILVPFVYTPKSITRGERGEGKKYTDAKKNASEQPPTNVYYTSDDKRRREEGHSRLLYEIPAHHGNSRGCQSLEATRRHA